MRPDMSKVIVERPRPGSHRRVKRRFRRFDPRMIDAREEGVSYLPSQVGHKRIVAISAARKSLNENLKPLQRYLRAQIGRPWSRVWSDLSAHVRADNIVQQHVRDHVQDFVAYRTGIKNGCIFLHTRWGGPRSLAQCEWPEMYVDPRTGLLCRNPNSNGRRRVTKDRQRDRAIELAKRMRVIDRFRQLHLLSDGNWWEVTLARDGELAHPAPGAGLRQQGWAADGNDVVLAAGLSSLAPEDLYAGHGIVGIAKRALSSREIKAHGLRSD